MVYMIYSYGMKKKFTTTGQPLNGLLKWKTDLSGKYTTILAYSRSLTDNELAEYGLEFISKERWYRGKKI